MTRVKTSSTHYFYRRGNLLVDSIGNTEKMVMIVYSALRYLKFLHSLNDINFLRYARLGQTQE